MASCRALWMVVFWVGTGKSSGAEGGREGWGRLFAVRKVWIIEVFSDMVLESSVRDGVGSMVLLEVD